MDRTLERVAPRPTSYDSWQSAKSTGNAFFTAGDFLHAESAYLTSMMLLHSSLAPKPVPKKGLSPLVDGAPDDDDDEEDESEADKKPAGMVALTPELVSDLAALHANRSAALTSLGRFAAALDEAELAARVKPSYAKAFFRKAAACEGLGKLSDAARALERCITLDPNSPGVPALKRRVADIRSRSEEDKPALARIDAYLEEKKTIIGCPVQLSASMFISEEELGEGNYSAVHHVVAKKTNEAFALKIVDKKKAERTALRHGNLRQELRMERRCLSKLSHPNIIQLYHTFQDASNIYYLEELAEGKELWSKLRTAIPESITELYARPGEPSVDKWPADSKLWGLAGLRPSLVSFYLTQIIDALVYLGEQGIVHRDLKPENIMITRVPGSSSPWRAERLKLIDFGTARDLLDIPLTPEEEDAILPMRKDARRSSMAAKSGSHFIGTPEFMSPEQIHGEPADPRADQWALGCTMYQLFTGRTPFRGVSDYLTYLKAEAGYYAQPGNASPEAKNLIAKLLSNKPDDRFPTARSMTDIDPYVRSTMDFVEARKDPRRPVATLVETCVSQLGSEIWLEAEKQGTGPLARSSATRQRLESKYAPKEVETREASKANLADLRVHKLGVGSQEWTLVRSWLEMRSILSSPFALSCLFPTQEEAQFARSIEHEFLGLSQQEESNFAEPYLFGLIGCDLSAESGKVLGTKLSAAEPTSPRAVFVHGDAAAKNLSSTLSSETAIVVLGNGKTYRSLWIGGVLYLLLDSANFDEVQAKWFERELLVGRYSARYVVVLTNTRWFTETSDSPQASCDAQADEKGLMPRTWRRKFLKEMQESGVKSVFVFGTKDESKSYKFFAYIKRQNESQTKLEQYVVSWNQIRIGRALEINIVSDDYELEQIPKWFNLAVRGGSGAYEPSPHDPRMQEVSTSRLDEDSDEGF